MAPKLPYGTSEVLSKNRARAGRSGGEHRPHIDVDAVLRYQARAGLEDVAKRQRDLAAVMPRVGNFSLADDAVVVGNDTIQVSGSIGLPAWLYGGEGNDRVKGGAGDDVIAGGTGNDVSVVPTTSCDSMSRT
mgnify:CR=1 FL=1